MALQDVRFALRTLFGKHRTLAAVCVLTLALGIGATTAIFTVLKAVVLEPLPYREPERLVQVMVRYDSGGLSPYNSGPDFWAMRDRLDSFQSLSAIYAYSPEGFNLALEGRAQRVSRLKVSSGYFQTLGVAMAAGRGFRPEENLMEGEIDPDRPASYAPARPLAVLSYGLWIRLFNGDPSALGQDLVLDGRPYTIVGVMPRGFVDPVAGRIDVFVPQNLSPGGYNNRGNNYLTVMGRLKAGASLESAQEELQALDAALAEQYSGSEGRRHELVPLQTMVVGDLDRTLWVLTAAVGTLLLVACVNVANLLLSWGASRKREIAVRQALGSGRARIVRQLLTESLMLAGLGGAGGLAVAAGAVPALLALRPDNLPPVADVGFDLWTFAFCAAAALSTGLLFGLAPALRASRTDLESALRETGREGGQGGGGAQKTLVAAQVALAVVLLAGAGLLAKSFMGLMEIELGFNPRDILVYRVDLPLADYPEPQQRADFYNRLNERLEASPGIRAAGSISQPPVSGAFHIWGFRIEGLPEDDSDSWRSAQMRVVDGHYFQAFDIRLLRGRLFEESDRADAPPVILVNEALAESYFPDEEMLGKRLHVAGQEARTVVGVVENVLHRHLRPAAPKIYLPHEQFAGNRNWKLHHFVEYEGAAEAALSEVRRTVSNLDPGLAVFGTRLMEDIAASGISQQRFAAFLMGIFSACALFLAAVGLYGVLSHSVQRRRREIGIRMAVGAQRRDVGRLVVGQALGLAAAGILVGGVAALGLTRWMSSMLHGVEAADPQVYLMVSALLAAISLAVAALPARRAARLDPMRVLREE